MDQWTSCNSVVHAMHSIAW